MVKFYCLCIDAFPELPGLKDYLLEQGFQRSDLICAGAFTTATMTSIISGTVGSEIIPGGIGADTSYQPRFLSWRKANRGHSLVDLVRKSGKDLIVHNHIPWMAQTIVGHPLSKDQLNQHYRDHRVESTDVERYRFGLKTSKDRITYYSTHPDMTLNTFVEWGNPEKKAQFYRNEALFFEHIGGLTEDALIWSDLCHWHEAVYYPKGNPYHDSSKNLPVNHDEALKDPLAWLRGINFNQPDSFFFIYADHSHRVQDHLDPPGFITWAYTKDTRTTPERVWPILSSYDVYPLICHVLNLEPLYHLDHARLPLFSIEDSLELSTKEVLSGKRIYLTEDGRKVAKDNLAATAFAKTRRVEDHYISVVKIIPQGPPNYPPGYYVKITQPGSIHNYDIYAFTKPEITLPVEGELTQVRCEGPLSEIRYWTIGLTKLPLEYLLIVLDLGLPL